MEDKTVSTEKESIAQIGGDLAEKECIAQIGDDSTEKEIGDDNCPSTEKPKVQEIGGDTNDDPIYDLIPEVQATVKVGAGQACVVTKQNENKQWSRNVMGILVCIAITSVVVSSVSITVSVWSVFKPTPCMCTNQQNHSIVTQDQLEEARNSTMLIAESVSNNLVDTVSDKLEAVNQTLSVSKVNLEMLSVNLGIMNDTITTELEEINAFLLNKLLNLPDDLQPTVPIPAPQCGPGSWHSVAFLNMSDPSQRCPSVWREYTSSSVRSCGRPEMSTSCSSVVFRTRGKTFSRVCGRIIGYQQGTPDAFLHYSRPEPTSADDNYVDGVSVTHGNPRTHIWTFAAGYVRYIDSQACNCGDHRGSQSPSPAFVHDNYFCGSSSSHLATEGVGCSGCVSGLSCCSFNSPVELPSSTTDDIEVRICGDEGTDNEDTPIELLEIYVQ